MRICDRCGKKQIKTILQNKQDYTEHDLCSECNDDFIKFLSEKENKQDAVQEKEKKQQKKVLSKPKQGGKREK